MMRNGRRRLLRWKEQGGKCCWCQEPTYLPHNRQRKDGTLRPLDRMATLEHLDDKFSPLRGKCWGTKRTKMACWRCNTNRSQESQAAQPIEVLRAKSSNHKPKVGL